MEPTWGSIELCRQLHKFPSHSYSQFIVLQSYGCTVRRSNHAKKLTIAAIVPWTAPHQLLTLARGQQAELAGALPHTDLDMSEQYAHITILNIHDIRDGDLISLPLLPYPVFENLTRLVFHLCSVCVYIHLCSVYVYTCVPAPCLCGGQRTGCRDEFSSSTTWALGLTSGCQVWWQVPLPAESSHPLPHFKLQHW